MTTKDTALTPEQQAFLDALLAKDFKGMGEVGIDVATEFFAIGIKYEKMKREKSGGHL